MLRLILLVCLLPGYVRADDGAQWMVRARLEPSGPVVVGQPVQLVVDVLVTTWFAGAPQFPPLDVPGALATLSDDQPAHLTEDIQGTRWFGISRIYRITPMEPRDYAIPRLEILVHPGLVEKPVRLWTPTRKLHAQVPPGAEGMAQFFATTHLDVSQRFDRRLEGLRVGDAFTRTLTLTADGTPGMFLPPLSFAEVDGLAVYSKASVVKNLSKDRQGFVAGRRTDSATYTIQRAGRYHLPEVTVQWWDSVGQKVRGETIPSVTFDVTATPGYRPEIAIPEEATAAGPTRAEEALKPSRLWMVGLVGLLMVLGWLWPRLKRYGAQWAKHRAVQRQLYEASEAAAFARLCQAAELGDDEATVRSLYQWLDRCRSVGKPSLAEQAVAVAGEESYRAENEALFDRCFGSRHRSLVQKGRDLERSLHQVRERLNGDPRISAHRTADLPPLNPG